MSTDIAKLQLSVDSREALDAERALDNLAESADRAERETQQLAAATRSSNKALAASTAGTSALGTKVGFLSKQFKVQKGAVQQAGYQLQDFAVQVSGGTSALVAFGQQGSQMAGMLGPGGAVIGAIIAISSALSGVFLSSLKNANKETEQLKNDWEDLADRFREISAAQLRGLIINTKEQIKALEDMGAGAVSTVSDFEQMQALFGDISVSFASNNKNAQDFTDTLTKGKSARDGASEQLQQLILDLKNYEEQLESVLRGGADPDVGQTMTRLFPDVADSRARRETLQGELDALAAYDAEVAAERLVNHQKYAMGVLDYDQILREDTEEQQREHLSRMASYYAEYTEARIKGDQAAADKAIEAEELKQANILTIQRSFDSLFRDMMDSQSREVFEAGKIGAASKAVADAYSAINATLAQGGAFAWPAAIATGAAAFANVASIMGTEFGSQSGATAPAAPPPTMQNTTNNNSTSITITGGVGFGIDELRELFGPNGEVVIYKDSPQGRELAR